MKHWIALCLGLLLIPALSFADILLTWTAPTSGGTVDNYLVWRQVNDAAFINIATVSNATFTYLDTTPGPRNCYYVVAKNAGGEGSTPTVCVTITAPPARPATFTAVPQ